MRRRHVAPVQEGVRGQLERLAVLVWICGVAVELEQNILDVALDEGALARRDVDDERRPALARQRQRVVADHRRDEDDESRDDADDAALPRGSADDSAKARARAVDDLHYPATCRIAYMPPR